MAEKFMRRAIALSRRGYPAPNPHVGCVIVREGKIVGEGFHPFAGAPHAERMALAAAGADARGSDVYVTLEPCNHHGRTSPCSEALIAAKVRKVWIAVTDPNPIATGGVQKLRDAGIEVETGLLASEAAAQNVQFLFAMEHRRPYVTVKAAASLDGRIALPSGESQWITGPLARREGHRLRAERGAVLVGYRTVKMDDPRLTARLPKVVNPPLRVVLDPENALTGTERVFNDEAPTLRLVREARDPEAILKRLFEEGVTGVLIEGGAKTIALFLRADIVDSLELFLAPKLLGDGPAWVEGLGLAHLPGEADWKIVGTRIVAEDLWISAKRVDKV